MSEKNENLNSHEIAVVGYSQAGKTTLAVGLYATSTPDFTVTAKGEESENYLQTGKAALEAGEWVGASIASTDIRLAINRTGKPSVAIDFKEYRGEDACNSEAFKRDVVGNPRGALILLNPKMDILRDSGKRNEMIVQIKSIIDYLSEPGKRCSHLAFVITASDLLTTSLKDYKDEFDGYKEEITNSLNTNPKFRTAWKEFDVTVTGPLEDPEHPRIARKGGNTSREPFEWLIEQFESEDRGGRVKKAVRRLATTAATLLVLGGLAFAGWYLGVDRSAEHRISESIATSGKALDKAVQSGKSSDINKHCKEMEETLAFVSTNKSYWTREPFFECNKERYRSARADLSDRIERGRLAWLPGRMKERESELSGKINPEEGLSRDKFDEKMKDLNDFGKKEVESRSRVGKAGARSQKWESVQAEWDAVKTRTIRKLEFGLCTNFSYRLRKAKEGGEHRFLEKDAKINANDESWLKDLKLLNEDARQVVLVSDATNALAKIAAELCPVREKLLGRVDAYNETVLRRKFDEHAKSAALEATEEECQDWRREIEIWSPETDTGRAAQAKLLEDFDKKKSEWRLQYESMKFAKEAEVLRQALGAALNELEDTDKIYELLQMCKRYEALAQDKEELPLVDFNVRTNTWSAIQKDRAKLVQKLVDEKIRQVEPRNPKTRPNDSSAKAAALECVETLKNRQLISEAEYGVWTNSVSVKVGKFDADWVKWQDDECDAFVKRIAGREGCDMALDTLSGKAGYQDFCSDHPCAPKLNVVADKVNHIVMEAFKKIWSETSSYEGDDVAIWNPRAMKEREAKMQKTYDNLKSLVNATVKAGLNKNCKTFDSLKAYRFASACQDKHGIKKGGRAEAFQQKYVITRIDAMVVDNSWSKYGKVAFNASCVKFDPSKNQLVPLSVVDCKTLVTADNKQWRLILSKRVEVVGTPWSDAIFSMRAIEPGFFSDDEEDLFRLFQGGERFQSENGYDEQSFKLNEDVTIYVRIYVKGSGTDFLSFARPYLFGDN